jgi:hypothetical protein
MQKQPKSKKYSVTFITSDEYRREGRSYRYQVSDNSLAKLLILIDKHLGTNRKRIPWGYIAVYKNADPKKFEVSERLLFLPLRKY